MVKGSVNDAANQYMNEIGARVVAETGIPSDRFHLGKLIIRGLKDAPDFVLQINSDTGESETFGSGLKRSLQCAAALQKLGLQQGDLIVLLAPNHLDACIPMFASIYCGVGVATHDHNMKVAGMKHIFSITKPKLVFCQCDRAGDVKEALKGIAESKVVTFGGGDFSFQDLMAMADDEDAKEFKPAELDPATTTAFLVTTSGTTGLPKLADISYRSLTLCATIWLCQAEKFPTPFQVGLVCSPLQWLSAILFYSLGPILRFSRLQTVHNLNAQLVADIVNRHKPSFSVFGPTLLTTMFNLNIPCDFSSFRYMMIGGAAVSDDILVTIKQKAVNCHVSVGFGTTEICGVVLLSDTGRNKCRYKEVPQVKVKLVNPDTLVEITEPNVHGEMWVKGLSSFKGYYNNPEATKEMITEDNWLRTGDILYRDEHDVYHFVDRLKMLLKYNNSQISPVEVEAVIKQHGAVLDAVVTGIADPGCGDLVVACVTVKPGHEVTAQEIKDIVKITLEDAKQLRGGVVFLEAMPLTATGKIDRKRIKELVKTAKRE